MDLKISCHSTQKLGPSLYILLPTWWTKPNAVQHGEELVLGRNENGELCIAKKKEDALADTRA